MVESAAVKMVVALLVPLLTVSGCATESPEEKAAKRLARAEAALEECKRRLGLQGTPTPDTVILDVPGQRGQPLTTEGANLIRLKVVCRGELEELLAARQPHPLPR